VTVLKCQSEAIIDETRGRRNTCGSSRAAIPDAAGRTWRRMRIQLIESCCSLALVTLVPLYYVRALHSSENLVEISERPDVFTYQRAPILCSTFECRVPIYQVYYLHIYSPCAAVTEMAPSVS
jgi:hypothetical protein